MSHDAAIVAADAPPKKNKGGRPVKRGWEQRFLRAYQELGAKRLAAQAAAISYRTVLYRQRDDPAFRRQVRAAYNAHAEYLYTHLVRLGVEKHNVIALLASLKAHRRTRGAFVERFMTVNVNATTTLSADDSRQLLTRLLRGDRPLTLPEIPAKALDDAQAERTA